jgi:hypothetical protein
MDCFAALAMTLLAMTWLSLNTTPHLAARCARGFEKSFALENKEGAGNAGCSLHPRSRVQGVQKTHTSIQVQTGHPDIPCAMALRLIPCSPRRRIRLVTVADGLKDCLNPVGSTRLRQLDTSNGCQDHTVLPYAASRLRQKASPGIGVVRLHAVFAHGPKPALQNTTTRPTLPRPPHPAPTFVTMANAPLSRTGWLLM